MLAAVVAFASALVALVPGRSLALQARGPVNQEQRAGQYTVQLFLDPSAPGANEIHVTFIDPNGLGAGEMTAITATLAAGAAGRRPAAARHAAHLRRPLRGQHRPGRRRLPSGRELRRALTPFATTFQFKLRSGSGGGG